ncbi:YuiB family protein [Bacillus horti]|uniref:YuiB-like membrane protein n=1 Tax=Caldalkalibacillus horti TaxID=77523 RepID=A0ABT9VTS7_9BACI|nr:YuiB family protein [Bacillus horti]MDQ0164391.1 hypothetical protein [Bacillus horti]
MPLMPAQIAISVLLFVILFFGIGFILNMLLKTTWLPGAIIYPIVLIIMVNQTPIASYFKEPLDSLVSLGVRFTELLFVDYVILLAGLVGALLSGVIIRMLRSRGYRMF